MQRAVVAGNITEGHTRPLLMLSERPEQQEALFAEIAEKSLTVREAERIARGIATDRARKQDLPPELAVFERELTERLGTRVQIESRDKGGKIHIDFFSAEDLQNLLTLVAAKAAAAAVASATADEPVEAVSTESEILSPLCAFTAGGITDSCDDENEVTEIVEQQEVEETPEEVEEDLYSIRNFSV